MAIAALKPANIEFVSFASNAPERSVVTSAAALEAKVAAVRYRGATSYRLLGRDSAADTCLLVSDGQVTMDQEIAVPAPCRLFVVAPSSGASRPRLAALAQAGGGQLVEAGGGSVNWNAPAVERVTDAGGRPLPFTVLPGAAGRWTLLAQAPASGAARVTAGGMTVERMATSAPVRFDGAASLLAAARLPLMEGTASREQYVAMSRRYAIASPSLSFVVLDTPEDYVRNGVQPPANYPQAAKVAELQDAADANRKAEEGNRLAQVIKLWADQLAWYDKKFDLSWRPVVAAPHKSGAVPPPVIAPAPPMMPPGTPAPRHLRRRRRPRPSGRTTISLSRPNGSPEQRVRQRRRGTPTDLMTCGCRWMRGARIAIISRRSTPLRLTSTRFTNHGSARRAACRPSTSTPPTGWFGTIGQPRRPTFCCPRSTCPPRTR